MVDAYKTMDNIGKSLKKIDAIVDDAREKDPEFYAELKQIGKAGELAVKFEKDMARWKARYKCTLGGAAGWCDGTGAVRCPQRLNEPDRKSGGCFLAI